MATLLVATTSGCRVFTEQAGESTVELAGHAVGPLAAEADGTCVAIVDGTEVWRRRAPNTWSKIATASCALQAIVSVDGVIFAGGMDEAVMLRLAVDRTFERLVSFDEVQGRAEWFAGGPPLGVRSLAAARMMSGTSLLAAVHVGGIPRSIDLGTSWHPTLPVQYDVHEVCEHPSIPGLVAAAAAVGLCISRDGGQTWQVHAEGLPITNSLSVAALEDEVLFSIEDGPFARQSQLWRLHLADERLEQVRGGLPDWFEGKIDTGSIAAARNQAAVIDKGGNLWLSQRGSAGWRKIAQITPYVSGLLLL